MMLIGRLGMLIERKSVYAASVDNAHKRARVRHTLGLIVRASLSRIINIDIETLTNIREHLLHTVDR